MKDAAETEEKLVPDPLNATLLSTTATKPVPKLSARKTAKANATIGSSNLEQQPMNNTVQLQPTTASSLPSGDKITSPRASAPESSPNIHTSSSTAEMIVQQGISADVSSPVPNGSSPVINLKGTAKQGRPTDISASPPKGRVMDSTIECIRTDMKEIRVGPQPKKDIVKIHEPSNVEDSNVQKLRPTGREGPSVPVLTVQSLPQANISSSRIVVSQSGDSAEPAAIMVNSSTTAGKFNLRVWLACICAFPGIYSGSSTLQTLDMRFSFSGSGPRGVRRRVRLDAALRRPAQPAV